MGSRQKIENPRDLFIYPFLTPILNAFPSCHAPMQFNETFPLSQGKLGSSFQHIFRCILGKCEAPWRVARINKFLRCFLSMVMKWRLHSASCSNLPKHIYVAEYQIKYQCGARAHTLLTYCSFVSKSISESGGSWTTEEPRTWQYKHGFTLTIVPMQFHHIKPI